MTKLPSPMSPNEPPDLPQSPELPAVLEFPIVPRPESRASTIRRALTTIILFTLLGLGLFAQGRESEEMGWIVGFAALFGLVLAILFAIYSRQRVHPAVLRIEPEHVRWQSTVQGTAEVALPYAELWVAHKEGRGDEEKLALRGREKGLIVIPTAFLPDAGADAVLAAVRERIGTLPDGRQRLEGIAARAAVADRIRFGRQIIAPIVAVLLGLVFLAELATGALTDPIRLLTFGANSSLVFGGELFRLATANLLHGSVLHLLFNVVVLVSLGAFLEPLLGRERFLSVLLMSALAGAAGSLVWGHALSIGASTGASGLIAAYVAILWRWPDRVANRPTKWTWITIVLAFVWPSLIFENVDHAAHLAGFLTGLVMTSLATQGVDPLALADRRRSGYRITAALLVAVFGAAGWTAVLHARDPQHGLRDASIMARDTSLPPSMRNSLAWHIATSPDASMSNLQSTRVGIWRVTESNPENAMFRDTLATVHYRLGQWEEAVLIEHEVFADDRTPFHAAQLARFEWAHLQTRGPLLLGEAPRELPRAEIASGPAVLLGAGLPPGALVHLVLAREGKASALLEVTLGASGTSGPLLLELPRDPSVPVPDRVSLALVDTRKAGAAGETARWDVWPVVSEAARLP